MRIDACNSTRNCNLLTWDTVPPNFQESLNSTPLCGMSISSTSVTVVNIDYFVLERCHLLFMQVLVRAFLIYITSQMQHYQNEFLHVVDKQFSVIKYKTKGFLCASRCGRSNVTR